MEQSCTGSQDKALKILNYPVARENFEFKSKF